MSSFQQYFAGGDLPESEAGPGETDRYVAMLAHDINAALQAITGGAALLEREAGLPKGITEQIRRIGVASHHLSRLVAQLVSDSADTGPGHTPLADFISDLNGRWLGEAEAHGVDFLVSAEADLPGRIAIPQLDLSRMVSNLVANAFRHSGHEKVVVGLARDESGGVEICVLDQGPGFAPEALLSGAEPAARPTGSEQAAGLGLRIVERLARKHRCELKVRRSERLGFSVSIEIPATLCEDDVGATPAAPAARETGHLDGMRILLAEDNQTNQLVAEQMLTALGANVVIASDGVEALDMFEALECDLLLVDIEMPRLSGLDVIRSVRARRDGRAATPIVALTAYAMREHRDEIFAAGADGLISKPIAGLLALAHELAPYRKRGARAAEAQSVEARDHERPGAGARLPGEEPPIDEAVFSQLQSAIGSEMVAELFEKVMSDLKSVSRDLEGALQARNWERARAASHILISVSGAVGATALQRHAQDLNAAARRHDEGPFVCATNACLRDLRHVLDFVQERYESLPK